VSCPAFVEVAEAIDERVVRPCPAALGGAVVGGDRSKADEFSEIVCALKRGSAVGAHLVEAMAGAIGSVEAGPAGHAPKVGHQDPFRSVSRQTIADL
jgi:hypothetical protein